MQRFISAPSFAVIVAFVFMFVPAGSLDAQTPGYSVSASPSAVFPCGRITVEWSAPAGHPTLYLSLYEVGGSYSTWWDSLPNSTSGTVILEVRNNWSPGAYVFRLATRDPFGTLQAVSNPFTIQGEGRCSPYFVAFPGEVGPQDSITIRWESMPLSFGCWIGFYRVGTACTNGIRYSEFITSPSGTWNIVPPPAGWSSGVYEFRYYFLACDDYLVARSNQITITATPSASLTVKGKVMIRTKPGSPPLAVTNAAIRITQGGRPVMPDGTTNLTGDYELTLPASYGPGQYTIQAILSFPGFDVVNYRYPRFDQSPELNPANDLIPLYRGLNPRMDIYVPQPVILVHGIFGGEDTWREAETLLRLDPAVKSIVSAPPRWVSEGWRWAGSIAHRGYIAQSVTYDRVPGTRDHVYYTHEENADWLRQIIDGIRANALSRHMDSAVPIDLVVHSMGGLIARAYLNFPSTPEHSVDRVFTFGTPHAGSVIFWFCWTRGGELPCGCPWSPNTSRVPLAAQQLDPIYVLGTFNGRAIRTAGAQFILIGSDRDRSPSEPECLGVSGLLEWDDMTVSTVSALFPIVFIPGFPWIGWHTRCDWHWQLPTNARLTLTDVLFPDLERGWTAPARQCPPDN